MYSELFSYACMNLMMERTSFKLSSKAKLSVICNLYVGNLVKSAWRRGDFNIAGESSTSGSMKG